jgi:hypothetical protein
MIFDRPISTFRQANGAQCLTRHGRQKPMKPSAGM